MCAEWRLGKKQACTLGGVCTDDERKGRLPRFSLLWCGLRKTTHQPNPHRWAALPYLPAVDLQGTLHTLMNAILP